jgi:thymidylate synthase (FAD)
MLGITVKLAQYTEDASKLIAIASKTSLSRKPLQQLLEIGSEEVEVWIKETFKRQHFSPWEHASYTFVIDGLSRIASHQLVRHRHASYTQMSHRYTEGYLRSLKEITTALKIEGAV